jgi:hypothetical protein
MQYNLRNETNIKNNGGNKWLKALEWVLGSYTKIM